MNRSLWGKQLTTTELLRAILNNSEQLRASPARDATGNTEHPESKIGLLIYKVKWLRTILLSGCSVLPVAPLAGADSDLLGAAQSNSVLASCFPYRGPTHICSELFGLYRSRVQVIIYSSYVTLENESVIDYCTAVTSSCVRREAKT